MPTPEPGRPLRVAVVGYGLGGSVFHAPLIAATPGMVVAAIVTGNSERQARAAHEFPDAAIMGSANELWLRPGAHDLVVISTPNRFHVPLAMRAVEAGIPVVVDKPLAATSADASRLVERARQGGVPLSVFQNRRWDGDFLTLHSLLDADFLGPVTRFESRFERYRPQPKGGWRELSEPEEAGGLLFDLGSHLIDQATVLFGVPQTVYAELHRRRPGVVVDDDTFVSLHFVGGVDAHLWMSAITPIRGPRFRVLGLKGGWEKYGLDPQEDMLRQGARPHSPGWGLEPPESWGRLDTRLGEVHMDGRVESRPGAYEAYYATFRDALAGKGPLPVDAEDAVRNLRVIEAAMESARQGRRIELG